MGAIPDYNRPAWANPIDEDLDWCRDNFHFLMCQIATGIPILPGWQTEVDISTGDDYAAPDGYVLSHTDGREIYINLQWNGTLISQVTVGYNDGVSSPGTVWFDPVTLTIAPPPTPITDGLGAWYKLDEASGTRVNSHVVASPNLYDLDDELSNTSSVTGIISDAADFTSGSPKNYLIYRTPGSVADRNAGIGMPPLGTASIISGCCWVKPDTVGPKYHEIIRFGRDDGGTGAFIGTKWNVYLNSDTSLSPVQRTFKVVFKGTLLSQTVSCQDVIPVAGSWYFIYWYWSDTDEQGGISVNNGPLTKTPVVSGASIFAAYGDIQLGNYSTDPDTAWNVYCMDGAIDEVGLWHGRTLSATDVTNLYNAGAGVTYEDLTWES